MYQAKYRIVLYGTDFSPSAASAKTGLAFDQAQESRSIATTGPRKGAPRGYGSANLVARPDLPEADSIRELLSRLESGMEAIRSAGADDIYFDAAIYWKQQCNLAYDPDVLLRIGQLGISFWISCYEDSDDEGAEVPAEEPCEN
jgi:hypothetical protein